MTQEIGINDVEADRQATQIELVRKLAVAGIVANEGEGADAIFAIFLAMSFDNNAEEATHYYNEMRNSSEITAMVVAMREEQAEESINMEREEEGDKEQDNPIVFPADNKSAAKASKTIFRLYVKKKIAGMSNEDVLDLVAEIFNNKRDDLLVPLAAAILRKASSEVKSELRSKYGAAFSNLKAA